MVAKLISDQAEVVQKNLQSADEWGKLGLLMVAHDFDLPSAQVFARASQLDDANPRWHHCRGVALHQLEPEAAIESFRKAATQTPEVANVSRLWLAATLIRTARNSEAETELKAYLAEKPDEPWAHMLAARLTYAQNDLDATREHLAKVQPPRAEAVLLQAELARREGNIEQARMLRAQADELRDVAWEDPYALEVARLRTGLKTLLSRADIRYGRDDINGSLELAVIAMREYPESDWAKLLAARALVRLRRYDEAEQILQQALVANPNLVEAHFRIGVIHFNREEYDLAVEDYRKAVELKPDFTLAYMNLGFVYQKLGKLEDSLKAFDTVTAIEPDHVDGWIMVGELQAQLGAKDKARTAWERAAELRPGDDSIAARLRGLDVDTSFEASDLIANP
jgi:tetratricopeptide (TPR) repeat protein